jgi:hypothetical protein
MSKKSEIISQNSIEMLIKRNTALRDEAMQRNRTPSGTAVTEFSDLVQSLRAQVDDSQKAQAANQMEIERLKAELEEMTMDKLYRDLVEFESLAEAQ